jgi:hypothetical protein
MNYVQTKLIRTGAFFAEQHHFDVVPAPALLHTKPTFENKQNLNGATERLSI